MKGKDIGIRKGADQVVYAVGEKIIYGGNGVCVVTEICTPNFSRESRGVLYYKLRPVGSSETIYVPVNSKAYMRSVMTRSEAERLIARMPVIEETVCASASITALRQQYEEFFRDHDCEGYVRLMKGVHSKGQSGKRLGQTDQRYLKRAEALLYGELAAALDVPVAEVPGYIQSIINE